MIKKYALLLIAIAILFVHAWAPFQGKISGVVTDKSGTPLEKVSVTIISQRTSSITFELITNKEGKFLQIGLEPGYYQVSFKKSGYMPYSLEVRVAISEETKVAAKLEKAEEAVQKNISEADQLFLKGNKLYEEKKYDEAVATYGEAIKLSQNQWGYYFDLGLAYKKLEKRDEATAAFKKALELNPEAYSINKEMGEIFAKAGNFEEAKSFYKKAGELSPDDPDASYNLGVCLLNTGESEAALNSFLKTIQLKADYADAYYQIGTLYIGQNRVKEAVESLEKFLTLAPSHEKAPLAKQLIEYLKK
jgi:tetratricopeptide (TPR) repeat protein